MVRTLPKIILAIFGAVAVLFLLIGMSANSGSLEVSYQNSLLTIQNVGNEPVDIRGVAVNDSADCGAFSITAQGNTLKIGESLVLVTLCDAVRTTITTADGSYTYYFKR
jgi:hypothetical protein